MQINSETFKKLTLLIFLGVVFYWAGHYLGAIGGTLKYILKVLYPLILGGCIAFVVNVLLRAIEGKWPKKMVAEKPTLVRGLTTLISYTIIILAIFIILFIVVPEISRSIASIASSFPTYIDRLNTNIADLIIKYDLRQLNLPFESIDWSKVGGTITGFLSKGGSSFVTSTVNMTSSIISVFVNLGLAIVFSAYILLSKEKLAKQSKLIMYAFIKSSFVDKVIEIANQANVIFTNFVKGQLLEALIIGVMCFIGMNIFGWPYATMISTLVGFTSLIPVLGAFIGTGVGAFLILLESPMSAVWFVIYIIVIQQIDSNFIYPKVVGKSVGLPGIWVLAAVTIGASLYGVVGMLIGVPLFSLFYAILRETVYKRVNDKNIKIETTS